MWWQGKNRRTRKKNCPSATLSTINSTWTSLRLNLCPSRWEISNYMAERWHGPARTCESSQNVTSVLRSILLTVCYTFRHAAPTIITNTGNIRTYIRNIERRLCNLCCSGKATNITYSECVFVDLGIQYVMRMRRIVICGLTGCTTFFTLSNKRHDFRKKRNY
jgi:hypothetical protein